MRIKTSDVEIQRLEMIDAASKVFAEKGYDGTSMLDIANVIGTTRTPLYYHFGSKDQLYLEVIQRISEIQIQKLKHIFANAESIFDKIEFELVDMLSENDSHISTILEDVNKHAELLPEAVRIVEQWDRSIFDIKEAFFYQAIEKGELRADIDTREAISVIFLFYYSMISRNGMRFVNANNLDQRKLINSFMSMFKKQYGMGNDVNVSK